MEQDDDWNGTRVDRLISRIVDRRAEPHEWSSFAELARTEPAHWEALLSSLRSDGALRSALAGALGTADLVETPLPSLSRWRQWTGWAAAGVLALCWAGSSAMSLSPPPSRPQPDLTASSVPGPGPRQPATKAPATDAPATDGPALRPTNTASGSVAASLKSDALPGYEQLPLQLMGTRPGPDGRGVEVLYVRPVVERTLVNGVYSLGTDELGRATPVQVDPAMLVASNKL